MLGYKYTTEQEAIADRLICDSFYGYPKDGCLTLHWVDYNHSELDNFYYIQHVEGLEVILGEPSEFTVTLPELG